MEQRILIACLNFYIGGISSHALKLSDAFRKLGYRTAAVVLEPYGQLYDEFRTGFDRLIVVPRKIEGRQSYIGRIRNAILSFESDVLINNGVAFIQAVFSCLPHEMIRLSVLHSIVENEVRIAAANARYTDKVIAVSENVNKAIRPYLPSEKIVQIPVGIRAYSQKKSSDAADRKIRMVYVGRVSSIAKNLRVIEKIIEELFLRKTDFHLTIIGDGDYLKEMKNNICRRPYGGCVEFTGALSPSEVEQRLPSFDIFLMTSTYEGTPHALLEAMSAGVIPVCSRISGATDRIITNGVSGFLCGTSAVNEYVEAIGYISAHPELRHKLSEKACETVLAAYSADRIAEQYLNIILACKADKPVSVKTSGENLISSEFFSICHGLPRHLRKCLGDIYRYYFHDIRPVYQAKEHFYKG